MELTQSIVEQLHVLHEHLALNAVNGGLQRNLAHHTQALDHLVLAVHYNCVCVCVRVSE